MSAFKPNCFQLIKFTLILLAGMGVFTAQAQTSAPIPAAIANNGKTWALIYQQRAAEYRALCFQAYNIARLRLDMAIKHRSKKPFAVVTDIDETLLDNSPYDSQRAVNNLEYSLKTWKAWTAKGV